MTKVLDCIRNSENLGGYSELPPGRKPVGACLIAGKNYIPAVWTKIHGRVKDLLDEFSNGESEVEDVYWALMHDQKQLWLVLNQTNEELLGWVITHVDVYPRKKRLVIDYVGGIGLDDWIHYLGYVEQFAAELGCTELEAWVRPGLVRKLERQGFRKCYEVMLRPIPRSLQG